MTRNDLAAWTNANRMARAAYAETKADHALPFGCDVCRRGADVLTAARWRVAGITGLLICGSCVNLAGAAKLVADVKAAAA